MSFDKDKGDAASGADNALNENQLPPLSVRQAIINHIIPRPQTVLANDT